MTGSSLTVVDRWVVVEALVVLVVDGFLVVGSRITSVSGSDGVEGGRAHSGCEENENTNLLFHLDIILEDNLPLALLVHSVLEQHNLSYFYEVLGSKH